jgi:predicted ferric reductase
MSNHRETLETDPNGLPPVLPLQDALLLLLIALAGVLLVLNLIPLWMPGLTQSTSGTDPKIFWFISRGSAIAAFWLLWLAMSMGVSMTNKMALIWPGIPPAYEVHQYTSLLGLGFALFHALILTGDHYIKYTPLTVLLPFASQSYKPIWVGMGQVAFYVWAMVAFSFYLRGRIGKVTWRLIHFASYACFLAVLVHGIYSGTDGAASWVYYSYWFSGGSLLFLTVYRILSARFLERSGRKKTIEST